MLVDVAAELLACRASNFASRMKKNFTFVIDSCDKRNEYLRQFLIDTGYKALNLVAGAKYSSSKKYVFVFAPATVLTKEIADIAPDGSVIFCIGCAAKIREGLEARGVTVVKIFDDEVLAVRNAILTAEGALASLIQNTDMSLEQLKVLIIGGGRVGKAAAKILQTVGCKVDIATRRKDEYSAAVFFGGRAIRLKDIDGQLNNYDAVINTVPARILTGERLSELKRECFVLDLASKPYGADMDTAKKWGIKYVIYSGVPGKVTPKTAAEQLLASILDKVKYKL